MAEAEILLAIEELDSFLMKYNESRDLRIMELVMMANKVRNDLRLILDFLSDKKLEEGSSLKNWISDVVEIARDAHLINDARFLNNDIDLTKWFRPISRVLGQTRKHILQLGVEGAKKPPITSPSPQEGGGDEYVVGLDQDTEFVLGKWIFRHKGELHTMCIVGMPGVGKTTLARKIYNHTAVVNRYKLRAWVCNYGESSKKEVLMKLILQVADSKDRSVLLEEMENAENYRLQQMLHQHLKGKQFLIVFDDIGKFPYFESIVEALPREDKQSKLLLTSRFRSIMNRVSTYPEVYTMKPLDDDRSWQLFFKLLLLEHQEFPKKLEREGRDMLRSCDGLPLSIKEVTTHCVTKRQSGSEWEQLLEPIELSTTLAVLESVYQRWSQQLKFCFLCLSFFKKGTPIRREKLIQVWTAGQVILQKEKEDEDEVLKEVEPYSDCLEGYKTSLMKLVDESIIEVDIRKYQSVKRIHINSSFHKLCIKKAKEEMIFGTLMKGESNPPSGQEPYHRAIYCSRDEFNHFKDHDKHLISLFFCGGGYFDITEPYWKRFKQLRTLDFEGFGLKMLPETIGVLTELRYLGLRDNYIQELPLSLGRLINLEVLDIALNYTMEMLEIISEIGSLRHLYMSDTICWKPLKIEKLEKLKTLTYIPLDNWTYEVSSWEKMIGLRELGIEKVDESSDLSKLFASLANLTNLDCLILRGFRFRSLPSLHGLAALHQLTEIKLNGLITKLPSGDIFPPNISHLSLINSSLDEDPMPKLGKLKYLSYLKLKNAYTGQHMVIPSGMFFFLQVLCIKDLWHLRSLEVEDDTFGLVELEIKSCPYLVNIPENIFMGKLKMSTTRRRAIKIRKLDYISEIEHVDIQP